MPTDLKTMSWSHDRHSASTNYRTGAFSATQEAADPLYRAYAEAAVRRERHQLSRQQQHDRQLWMEKYRPKTWESMIFASDPPVTVSSWKQIHSSFDSNQEQKPSQLMQRFGRIAHDCPHLCLYGPDGAGKQTHLIAFLHQIGGPLTWTQRRRYQRSFRIGWTKYGSLTASASSAFGLAHSSSTAMDASKDSKPLAASSVAGDHNSAPTKTDETNSEIKESSYNARRKTIVISFWSSPYHMEWDPSDVGPQKDRYVIEFMLRDLLSNKPIGVPTPSLPVSSFSSSSSSYTWTQPQPAASTSCTSDNTSVRKTWQWIVIHHAERLSLHAQQALRRVMEQSISVARFILITNCLSKLIRPLQSRCALVRFPALSVQSATKILQTIASREQMPPLSADLAYELYIVESNRNLAHAICALEDCRVFVPFSFPSSATPTAAAAVGTSSSTPTSAYAGTTFRKTNFYGQQQHQQQPQQNKWIWRSRPSVSVWKQFTDVLARELLHDPEMDRLFPTFVPAPNTQPWTSAQFLVATTSFSVSPFTPWQTIRIMIQDLFNSENEFAIENEGCSAVKATPIPLSVRTFLAWFWKCVRKRVDHQLALRFCKWFAECEYRCSCPINLAGRTRPVFHVEALALQLMIDYHHSLLDLAQPAACVPLATTPLVAPI